jgi:hypothetical protein
LFEVGPKCGHAVLIGFVLIFIALIGGRFLSWETLEVDIKASVDVDPDTLNLMKHEGQVTVYVELPGYDITDINVTTVRLWVDATGLQAIRSDFQDNRLMLKFDASDLTNLYGQSSTT